MGMDVQGGNAVHFILDIQTQRCYSGIHSAKQIAICAWIVLQSCRRPALFLVMSIMARCSILSRLSSVGNTDLVTLHSWRLKPSMLFMVDQPPDLLGILEVGTQICPVVSSGLGDFRVFLVSALPKDVATCSSTTAWWMIQFWISV